MSVAVMEETLDVLVEGAVRYGVIVEDGFPPKIAAAVERVAHLVSPQCRRIVAGHLVEHGDREIWGLTITALERASWGRRHA